MNHTSHAQPHISWSIGVRSFPQLALTQSGPHDIKFINGEANVDGWAPSNNDANAGTGKYGSCCNEMEYVVPDGHAAVLC